MTLSVKKKEITSLSLARNVRKALEAHKGERIMLFDVRKISDVTDFYILVSAAAPPHLRALADEVRNTLEEQGEHCYRQSGTAEDGWIALDYVDVIIHIFLNELRDYYALEELWAGAPKVGQGRSR